jgi:hypothetical protein
LPGARPTGLDVEVRINESDSSRSRGEDVVLADVVEVSASREQLHDVIVDAVKVKPTAEASAPLRFLRQHFRSRNIDKMDSGRIDEQMLLQWIVNVDPLQHALHVIDCAEEYCTVDAHDL